MAKISVIVPIYNVEKYLDHCLESLKCQTFHDIEVIGIDDDSKDRSADIFSVFQRDSRFKLIKNYENQGLPSARNLGILNSSGEYIFFVDSDDWLTPNALQTMLDVSLRDDVDIVIGGVAKYYDIDGRLETPENHGLLMAKERSMVDVFSEPDLFYSVIACNKLIKSDFIKSNGLIFKTTPRRYEDMLTYKWYLSGAQVSNISEVTYFYRQRVNDGENNSIMQDVSIDALTDKILAYIDIYDFVRKKGLLLTDADPLHAAGAMMNLPKALSWIFPAVFTSETEDKYMRFKFTSIAQHLVNKFDDNYIKNLPHELRESVNWLRSSDTCTAMQYCRKVYNKNI